jgi:integrase
MSYTRLSGIKKVRPPLADGTRREYHYIRGGAKEPFWRSDSGIAVGSREYLEAYERALGIEPAKAKPKRGRGTLRDLMLAFKASDEWDALRERTREGYDRAFVRIDAEFGDAPLETVEHDDFKDAVLTWVDKNWKGKPKGADHHLAPFRRLLQWGFETRGKLKINRLAGIGNRYQPGARKDIVWWRREVRLFSSTAYPALARAVQLMAETGLRPGDLVRLTRAQVVTIADRRYIKLKATQKSTRKRKPQAATPVKIPLTPLAAAIIDATPKTQMLILTNQSGGAWTEDWLTHAVGDHLAAIGLKDGGLDGRLGVYGEGHPKAGKAVPLHLYDLRGTAVTRLVREHISLADLALHMGWKASTAALMLNIYLALIDDEPPDDDDVVVSLDAARDSTGGEA